MHCQVLAEKEGLGRIVMCQSCNDVHLSMDSLSVRITQAAFVSLSEMMSQALRHPKICLRQDNPKEFMASRLFSLA
ncbi:MAG: hypothetical protein KCHDKBKB_02545 [Elusimicrobia bacterium]|nr:hypothetical protein [Elusimicrobiota bacterium]